MTEPPLAPPPRKAHFRRGVRALRRGYSTFLAVVALILAGWFGLDIVRWAELTNDQRVLTFGFAACAVLAFAVWMFVDNPWRRDLRLARRGEVARGVITGMHKGRGRPPLIVITYSFCTATGEAITGECKLRRGDRNPL
jgi:hypothetical protein